MKEMDELQEVMRRLRAPDGCPWDKVQTHETLKECMIGEMAEYLDAVDDHDPAEMREELGDLLMQIVLNSVIAEEKQEFTLADVTRDVTAKMIHRHPHVFGTEKAESVSGVLTLWEKIKKEEKGASRPSVLDGVPRNMSALLRAAKLQKKAAKVGFDWTDDAQILDKIAEEAKELADAYHSGNQDHVDSEAGDLMFAVVNFCRFRKRKSAEEILNAASSKFERRFRFIEAELVKQGCTLEETSPERMNVLWNEAKKRGL